MVLPVVTIGHGMQYFKAIIITSVYIQSYFGTFKPNEFHRHHKSSNPTIKPPYPSKNRPDLHVAEGDSYMYALRSE